MTQKQIWGTVVGVAVVASVFVAVYRQFSGRDSEGMMTSQVAPTLGKMKTTGVPQEKAEPVPDTIDGITGDIEAESATDLSALNDDETASLDEINQDSDSLNNLGTSYDENNL